MGWAHCCMWGASCCWGSCSAASWNRSWPPSAAWEAARWLLLGALAALYIGYKYFQRYRVLRELRMARITVDELHQKLEAGENPMILDLRPRSELEQDPALIRGALHMTMDEVDSRQQEIPRDRDIILYCSCPNEVSSARVALRLHRRGISRVRPVAGRIRCLAGAQLPDGTCAPAWQRELETLKLLCPNP